MRGGTGMSYDSRDLSDGASNRHDIDTGRKTIVSPILYMHRMVMVFGVLALLYFGAVYFFYATWLISVWYFFAALLSAVVYLHFGLHDAKRSRSTENSLSTHHL